MFQTLMGIKYVIADEDNVPYGYTLVKGNAKRGIYKNDNVLPLGYSSSHLISDEYFNEQDFAGRSELLLKGIVTENTTNSEMELSTKEINLAYDYEGDLNIKSDNGQYIIDVSDETTIELKLKEPFKNRILFISFDMMKANKCSDGDTSITINGIVNKLTCKQWMYFNDNYRFEYVITDNNEINSLNITFSKGYYVIEDIHFYELDYANLLNITSNIDKMSIDMSQTKGNVIVGNIDVTEDGYFATTIPYDKGYKIYVNNQMMEYEMVNEAFIGFPLSKGVYNIKIVYVSPGFNVGRIGSFIGLMLLVGSIIIEKKKKY
ncbi:MAG: YfhO family protein, partial [Bacilli bacterium]|jgi:uncharacterized membrane protein YfhO